MPAELSSEISVGRQLFASSPMNPGAQGKQVPLASRAAQIADGQVAPWQPAAAPFMPAAACIGPVAVCASPLAPAIAVSLVCAGRVSPEPVAVGSSEAGTNGSMHSPSRQLNVDAHSSVRFMHASSNFK